MACAASIPSGRIGAISNTQRILRTGTTTWFQETSDARRGPARPFGLAWAKLAFRMSVSFPGWGRVVGLFGSAGAHAVGSLR